MPTYLETFKLESNDEGLDLFIDGDNKFNMIDDVAKAKQDIIVLLKTQVGEDMFSIDFGFDFLAIINSSSESMVKLMIEQALARYQFLKSIESITIDSWNRETRLVVVTVKTNIGPVDLVIDLGVI